MVQQRDPLARGIPGVQGSRPPPQFGLGGFNDAAMALAYGGQTPDQAMQAFQQAEQRFRSAQGGAPGSAPPMANPYAQYGGFDPSAYLRANPDVARYYDQNLQRLQQNALWRNPVTNERMAVSNPYDWAYRHWTHHGQSEGRPLGI